MELLYHFIPEKSGSTEFLLIDDINNCPWCCFVALIVNPTPGPMANLNEGHKIYNVCVKLKNLTLDPS